MRLFLGGTLDSYYKEKMQQYIELKSYGSIVIGDIPSFAIKNIKIGNEYIVKAIYNYLASKVIRRLLI